MNRYQSKNIDRKKMREMYEKGYCITAVARKFNCHTNAVMHHISDLVVPIKNFRNTKSKLNDKQVKAIRTKYIKKNIPATVLSKEYGVSESTILNTIHGIYYRYVPGEVLNKTGEIYILPENYVNTAAKNKKGRKKCGPVPGKQRRPNGIIKPLAEKYGVSSSTICKWLKNGKLKEPKRKRANK